MILSFPALTTPETTDFMIAGYIVIFSVMIVYTISLYLRRKKLVQDLKILEEIADQADNP